MPRLWLRKLTSIGAVPEGDNPPASILLWKSKGGNRLENVEELERVEEAAPVEEVAPEAPDDIAKRIEDAEAEIRKARDERDAALQALKDEVAKRRAGEFFAKAQSLEPLLGPAEETAGTLEALEAVAPEAFAVLCKRLQVALSRVNLTGELGSAGSPADPLSQRDAWVRKFLTDHPDKTDYEARAQFWKANPEALEALRKDQQ